MMCECEYERVREEEAKQFEMEFDELEERERACAYRITNEELFEAAGFECFVARDSEDPDEHLMRAREIIELLWFRRTSQD